MKTVNRGTNYPPLGFQLWVTSKIVILRVTANANVCPLLYGSLILAFSFLLEL